MVCLLYFLSGKNHISTVSTIGVSGISLFDTSCFFCPPYFGMLMSCGFYRLFLLIPTVLADRGCITVFRTSRILMVFYFIIMSCSFDIFGFCCFTYLTGISADTFFSAGRFCCYLSFIPCML